MAKRYPKELLESAQALTELVASEQGFTPTMERLAQLAVHAIEGAEECSVTLAKGSDVTTVAATANVGMTIDRIQMETGEGPCLSSIDDHQTFHIPYMARDETWPIFSKRADDETGTRSMLCFVLRLSAKDTGAMNMISSHEDAFSDEDLDTGTLFAAQAAVAMSDAVAHQNDQHKIEQLEEGIKTRQVIGQAVGILMSSRQVTSDEAFEILKTVSQNSNTKLRDIAERIVDKATDI